MITTSRYRSRVSQRLADSLVHTKQDREERLRWAALQARIWRNLSIIFAHHPDRAKDVFLWMGLNGTLVGDIDQLEKLNGHWMETAMKCGRSLDIFAREENRGLCSGGDVILFPTDKIIDAKEKK